MNQRQFGQPVLRVVEAIVDVERERERERERDREIRKSQRKDYMLKFLLITQ